MPELYPSMDSRVTGDDASEDVELEMRLWPRNEKVGVIGEGVSGEDIACEY